MLLLPKLAPLKRRSEAGTEAGSRIGSQSGFQSDSQAGSQAGSRAGSEAASKILSMCMSAPAQPIGSQLAKLCQLPAIYSPKVPHPDVYEQTMDGYRLHVVLGSTGSLLWAAGVCPCE